MVKTINEVLTQARQILIKNGIDEREARLLLAFSLGLPLEKLLLKRECTTREYQKYMKIIDKRINKIPYAYIVGHKEFMKLDFDVNKNVLIPREDTEILVQEIIKINKKKILDMCTGSRMHSDKLSKIHREFNSRCSRYKRKSLINSKSKCEKKLCVRKFYKIKFV